MNGLMGNAGPAFRLSGAGDTPQRSAPTQPAVVQRAVGFEFETGWLVDQVMPGQKPVPFKKKDVVSGAAFDGFRMEADEAGDGLSEIEFVVRPPIEESPEGLKKLETVMAGMDRVGTRLKEHYDEPSFLLKRVTNAPMDLLTRVTPRKGDPELKAGPQATTGLDLAVVDRFTAPPKKSSTYTRFDGFLALVQEYLTRGTGKGGALSYPKMIAEPLLARTNFVGLLKLVEPEALQIYLQNPERWVPDVLEKIGLSGLEDKDILARSVVDDGDKDRHIELRLEIDEAKEKLSWVKQQLVGLEGPLKRLESEIRDYKPPIFGLFSFGPTLDELKGNFNNVSKRKEELVDSQFDLTRKISRLESAKRALEKYAGLTVGQWLSGILAGEDRLTQVRDAESLGEFGNRTEKIGPNQEIEAGIFEFRGDQAVKIPLDKWSDYAINFFRKILSLHGHP